MVELHFQYFHDIFIFCNYFLYGSIYLYNYYRNEKYIFTAQAQPLCVHRAMYCTAMFLRKMGTGEIQAVVMAAGKGSR